jgi:hypothetical protein
MTALRRSGAVHHGYPRSVVRLVLALVLLALAASPAAAQEQGRSIYRSPHLWATVNVCQPGAEEGRVGIRGSMPGSGFSDEVMWMRFQLQYLRPSDGKWHNMPAGDAGWVRAGSARIRRREAGRTFVVATPGSAAYTLRGVVTFEWRRDGEVVRRARKRTTAGHPEPLSASRCVLD